MRWIFFSNLPNSSSHTMTLGLIQPLTEMSIRNLSVGWGKEQLARKADIFTAICEPFI
jgi:hypothetical protein